MFNNLYFLLLLWPFAVYAIVQMIGWMMRRRMKRVPPGSNVVISGCSTGIGRDIAIQLALKGYRVFCGVRKQSDVESLKKDCPSDMLNPVLMDVTKQESVDAAFDTIAAQVSQIHCLINNAGVIYTSPVEFHDIAEFQKVLDVNVVGVVRLTRKFIPLLRKAEFGTARIINIGSLNGIVATPFRSAYCASKFALEAFNDSLRRELDPWSIFVSMINPGYIKTEIINKNLQGSTHLKQSQHFTDQASHYYGNFYSEENVEATLRAVVKQAADVSVCTNAVVDILTSTTPGYRYLVGPRVAAARMSSIIPSSLVDFNMRVEMWPQNFKVNLQPLE